MTSKPAKKTDTRLAILMNAKHLFAQHGYSGVSVRDIASACGIKAASLYHHFPDKDALYIATMEYAFSDKAVEIAEVTTVSGSPSKRLEGFIVRFRTLMADDQEFRILLQRELLDGNEERLKLAAHEVFERPFKAISDLAQDVAPDCDPHMLAISLAGLILFHFETAPIRKYLPGGKKNHNDPKVIAKHVMALLSRTMESP